MKIGILYPRSKEHPNLMVDFMDGIKMSVAHLELDKEIQFFNESVGFGGIEKEVYEKTEKLLQLDGVDVLVAFIDLRVLEILKPLIFSSGKLVLYVNAGANFPVNWVPQPNIINLTLNHGFLCWLSGRAAAENKFMKAAMSTSFFDCGYLHTAAMANSFMAYGGEITHNHINKGLYDDSFEIESLTDFLSSDEETDSMLCVFDSSPASLFYQRFSAFEKARNFDLFVSPMMLEPKALEKLDTDFPFTIQGFIPWHRMQDSDANNAFKSVFLQQTKRPATMFSLMGWEAGQVLNEIYNVNWEDYSDGAGIVDKIADVTIKSPRGEIKLDADTNYFLGPVWFCNIERKSGDQSITSVNDIESRWAEFTAMKMEGLNSGWTNTYLCY